jgi:hypothetical protein
MRRRRCTGHEIGDADATNRQISDLGVGFGRSQPPGEKSSRNVECLRRQKEKGDRDTRHLRHQFVTVIKKYDSAPLSRREGRLVAKN